MLIAPVSSSVILTSWHTTQPVYSADFQPIPAPQLRKILPFPNPTPAPTPSASGSGSTPAPAPFSAPNETGSTAPAPGTPSRKPTTESEDGISTPVGPGAGPGTTPTQSGRTVSSSGGLNESGTSGSGGPALGSAGYNPAATRSYRLATAGADSCVRVSPNLSGIPTCPGCLGTQRLMAKLSSCRFGPFIPTSPRVPPSMPLLDLKSLLTLLELFTPLV